jgi:hypothetical protein
VAQHRVVSHFVCYSICDACLVVPLNKVMHIPSNPPQVDWDSVTKWLRENLTKHVVTVEFIKKDGNLRIMNCTLNSDLLPPAPELTEEVKKQPRKISESTMAVYDVDAKGWRSFTITSIKTIEIKT